MDQRKPKYDTLENYRAYFGMDTEFVGTYFDNDVLVGKHECFIHVITVVHSEQYETGDYGRVHPCLSFVPEFIERDMTENWYNDFVPAAMCGWLVYTNEANKSAP